MATLPAVAFPLRACLHVALGALLAAAAFHLWPHDPCALLDPGMAVEDPLAEHPELRAPKAADETRVLFVGSSLTAGFPYGLEASFPRVVEEGLRDLFPERRIVVRALAKPALDSTRLAELVDAALLAEPDAVWVVLGDSEVAGRLFAERDLAPRGWIGWLSDHGTRSRDLFRALAPAPAPPAEGEVLAPVIGRLPRARAAAPVVAGLPVPARDLRLLAQRTQGSVGRMAAAAEARGVPLALLLTPYDLAGSWPWGMVERAEDVDAAVLAFRRSGEVDLPQAEALARLHPERADARFLLGQALLAAGEPEAARGELIRARDLDPAPLHLIGEVERAILAQGALLGVPVFALDEGTYLPGTRVPDPACFLDPGHWSVEGIRRGAAYVAQLLSEHGTLGRLPPDWRPAFDAAAGAHLSRVVDEQHRGLCAAYAERTTGLFHATFGNVRDGALPLADGVQWYTGILEGPDDPLWIEWALRVLRCAAAAADRSEELSAGPQAAQGVRLSGLARRLWRDGADGRARELVWRILDGEDLDSLAAP